MPEAEEKSTSVKEQERATRIIREFDQAKADRATLDTNVQEVADWVIPKKGYVITKRTEGEKVKQMNTQLFDATAPFALQMMTAGLVSHLAPANSKWFALKLDDDEIVNEPRFKSALAKMTNILHEEFAVSNFYNMISEIMENLGWAGQACLEAMPGKDTALNFRSYHYGEIYMRENSDRLVDTVFYKFQFTARQAKQEYGEENLSKSIKDALAETGGKGGEKKFWFIEKLSPREEFDSFPARGDRRPIAQEVICVTDKAVIKEDGFYEMPKLTPRWSKATNEVNGRSQGMFSLPWIKGLNTVIKDWIQGVQLRNRPIMLTPDDGFVGPVRAVPGGIWHYKASLAANANAIRPLDLGVMPKDIKVLIDWFVDNIRRGFYNDLFIMAEKKQTQTILEISERIEEKHVMIVPPIGRLQTELFNGTIVRSIGVLGRAGRFRGILPPELIGKAFQIQYISKLALAVRMLETRSIGATHEMVERIGARNPQIFDNFDDDETARGIADRLGYPPEMMRDPEEVKRIREIRQADIEAQQMAELAAGAADAVPKLQKKTEAGSPLEAMVA